MYHWRNLQTTSGGAPLLSQPPASQTARGWDLTAPLSQMGSFAIAALTFKNRSTPESIPWAILSNQAALLAFAINPYGS
ncbi:hypothetical protein VTJ04DRAFT_7435 [Mycothermus thermophilus]|uniref:uncharacterized protein n=1 Tax=Humicola insolens TaxID=85995 RepID=UPI0037438655